MTKDTESRIRVDNDTNFGLLGKLKDYLRKSKASTSEELEKEIQGLVDQGEAKGLIAHREADMIEAVLDLNETTAGQIMAPRTDLAMVHKDAAVDEIIEVIIASGHSRIPLYSEDPDHILGVIHAKDLLPYWGRTPEGVSLSDVMRKPFFVPQAMPVGELMAAFKRKRVHLAIVVDEYGGTAGVVTMEDVLEEIVGEIEDEYDQEEKRIAPQEDGSFLVDARLEMDELNDQLGIDLPESLPEGRFETVGGFITTLLGRVPKAQEKLEHDNVRIVVVGADDRRVTRVQVFPLAQVASEPEE